MIQTSDQSSRQDALFVVCVWRQRSSDQDDHKGKESHNETCFQDPQSCPWLVIRSNQFGPKIQIRYIDTKNQLADTLTKGNFTRDEWNHLLCLFNITHCSSINSVKAMSKRTQVKKESQRSRGQWWVLLQGLPQHCHLRRQKARRKVVEVGVPGVRTLRKMIERGNPLSAVTQVTNQCCHKQFVESSCSAHYAGWDDDKAWSRSFLDRVNDQMRKRQKRSSMNDCEKHSVIWGMFMSSTLESSVFMWKNYSDNWLAFHQEYKRSHNETNVRHLRNWCPNKMRYMAWKQLVGKIIHGNICLWLVMNKSSIFSAQRSTSFQILYCVLVRYTQSNSAWEQRLEWFKTSQEYRNFDRVDGEPMECEWNIFPGFNTLQLNQEVKSLLLKLDETPENFTGKIIFMSMFNDISWGSRDNEKECESNARLVSLNAKRIGKDNGHFSILAQRKSGVLSVQIVHNVNGTESQRRWWWHSQKADTQSSVPRVHCPELKSKGGGKLSIHYCADLDTIKTVFRTIFSVIGSIFTDQSSGIPHLCQVWTVITTRQIE